MTEQSLPGFENIYVAGHRGMVGQSVTRALKKRNVDNIICRTRQQLDLCNQSAVEQFFESESIDAVIFAAAKVGGIHANSTYPAEFIYENVMMAANCIQAAFANGVKRFLFLGSTCIYPRLAPQPMPESCLLTSPLEPTNEAYAIAKIAGLKMCQFYRAQYGVVYHSAMPTNLYGPGDNYHPEHSHVMPALIRRFHEAHQNGDDQVTIWGSGTPRREFLHVDDLADGVLHLMQLDDPPDVANVGTGIDVTIAELAELVSQAVGYEGQIVPDPSKPDGTPIKRTDCSLIESTGWSASIDLVDGIQRTYQDFLRETESDTLRAV